MRQNIGNILAIITSIWLFVAFTSLVLQALVIRPGDSNNSLNWLLMVGVRAIPSCLFALALAAGLWFRMEGGGIQRTLLAIMTAVIVPCLLLFCSYISIVKEGGQWTGRLLAIAVWVGFGYLGFWLSKRLKMLPVPEVYAQPGWSIPFIGMAKGFSLMILGFFVLGCIVSLWQNWCTLSFSEEALPSRAFALNLGGWNGVMVTGDWHGKGRIIVPGIVPYRTFIQTDPARETATLHVLLDSNSTGDRDVTLTRSLKEQGFNVMDVVNNPDLDYAHLTNLPAHCRWLKIALPWKLSPVKLRSLTSKALAASEKDLSVKA